MMNRKNLKDVTNQLIKETEEFIERLDDYESPEASLKQIRESYEESRENY